MRAREERKRGQRVKIMLGVAKTPGQILGTEARLVADHVEFKPAPKPRDGEVGSEEPPAAQDAPEGDGAPF